MRHLKMYRAIQIIHRTGSIRRAATDLAISPSALNRAVQAFEDELSFTIFQRNASGVELSEAGELLLTVTDRHLIEFGELQRQLGRMRDGEIGDLKISVGTDVLAGEVAAVLADMESAHPRISIEVLSDDGIDGLRTRQTHLALLTNPVTDDAIEVVHAQSLKLVALQSRDVKARPASLWDLTQMRLLLPPDGTGSRTALRHLFRRNRLEIDRFSSLPASQVAEYLQGADRVAIFPESVVQKTARSEGVTQVPLNLGTVQFCVLRSARTPMTRTAQLFLTRLQLRLVDRITD